MKMHAQYSVQIKISSVPSYHPAGAELYLAGSFNGWNPQDEKFKLSPSNNGVYTIQLSLPTGIHEFKITRGSWDKVECGKDGFPIENRFINLDSDTALDIRIEEWADRFPGKPKSSTASKNVRIIDTAFFIPQLKRVRKVWIYLPEEYANSNKRYPVIYMHDGQNVFDESTAFSGEWGVDDFLDTTNDKQSIVVAVDHGSNKRINEYDPYDNERFGKGEGNQYLDFLVKTLKPFIDKHYRTIKNKENTFVAGSSMGGLISFYAVLRYPKVFGGAGVFSPSFSIVNSKIFDDIQKKGKTINSKLYFYVGKLEGGTMVPDMLKVFETLVGISKSKMISVIRDDGRHNEVAWRKEFPLFYEWIFTHP